MSPNIIIALCFVGIILTLCVVCYILYKNECEHDMIYRGYKSEWDSIKNITWSIRKYECQTCGYIEWVDTRYGDPFFPKAWKH